MSSYFFESAQPFNEAIQPVFYRDQQRVHLRTSAGWGYPMGTVAKVPAGWVHSAPPQPSSVYPSREAAAAALHDWFEAEGFAGRPA